MSFPKAVAIEEGKSLTDSYIKWRARLLRSVPLAMPSQRAKLHFVFLLLPYLNKNDRCMDIGVGSGGFASRFSMDGSWTYVDKSNQNIEIARTCLKGDFICGMAEEALLQQSNLSAVTMLDKLEYMESPSELFERIFVALKPGGHLIISENISATERRTFSDIEDLAQRHGFRVRRRVKYVGSFALLTQVISSAIFNLSESGNANTSWVRSKYLLSLMLRVPSLIANLLDRAIPYTPHYGDMYLLVRR